MTESWDNFLNEELLSTNNFLYAAVVGIDGAIWAKSAEWGLKEEEIDIFTQYFENEEEFYNNGITIGGEHFVKLIIKKDLNV
jgi:hypothetical protein